MNKELLSFMKGLQELMEAHEGIELEVIKDRHSIWVDINIRKGVVEDTLKDFCTIECDKWSSSITASDIKETIRVWNREGAQNDHKN